MKIVNQNWGNEEYKKEAAAYANSCVENGQPETYWGLYTMVLEEGADAVFNRIFRDSNELPDIVKDGLHKVCRYMEYCQNIPILNPN